MKTPFSALFALFCLMLPLSAQEGDGLGFLNIVNLIPGKIPADVTIAGKELMPGGLVAGSATGWFMVPVGGQPITIALDQPEDTKLPIEKGSGQVELVDGVANVIAIFLQPDNRTKKDGTPYPPKIRIRSFPAFEGKGFALTFISTCPDESRFQLGPNQIETKPLAPLEIPNWSGAPFDILRNSKTIGHVIGSSEQGSFYLFVGTNPAGEYVTAFTHAGTQTVPPWMKKDKTAEKP